MALPYKSHHQPLDRPRPIKRIPLLQRPGRETQPALYQRNPDPRNARQFRNHATLRQTSRRPQRQHQSHRLGLLRRRSLARARRSESRRRFHMVRSPHLKPLPQAQIRLANMAHGSPRRRRRLARTHRPLLGQLAQYPAYVCKECMELGSSRDK